MSLTDQQWCPTSVQVTVHQAKGLRIKGKSGTNDAYAVMQVGKEKFQTSVVEKSVAPVWKEEAAFDLPQLLQGGGGGGRGADRSTLHVHVLHRALVGPDKLLGQAVINLLQLSEDKSREKTEWFKLLDKTGKPDKERGEVLLDIQFMRNNMTASMFDLSAAGKSRSRLGKIKDKVRGKKKDSDSASSVVPALTQVLTDSEEEESANGVAEGKEGKEKSKKQKMKSLFAPKSNLQKNMSQSMSVLPGKNSSLSGSQSSGLNVDVSEGKKKFKFSLHKRSGSSDGKTSSSGHQKPAPGEQSNLCINGSHVYCEEPQPRTSRATSNFSLLSSGHGSMEEVPDNSPPSGDSLTAVRESPWMEEEEEEEEGEEEEAENVKEDVNESRKEEEQRIRIEEEALRRQQEELEKFEKEKLRREEEMRLKVEMEEEEMKREEEMLRQQEELEKLKQEEKEMRRAEEERTKREEEERIKVQREEEERKRIEEEEEMLRQQVELERLAEEKLRQEEEERRWAEEERAKREEEEKKVQREEEEKRKEEEMLRQESERQAEEKARQEEEEQKRLAEEMRKLEEEKRKREEEERIREEEEEEARQEEEHRLAEERRLKEEENERTEEERRQKEQLVRKREEQKRQMEEEERLNEELRRREEEETARREREEQEKWMEEKRRIEAEEKIRKDEEERARMEEEKLQREQEERRRREEEETLRRRELEKLAQEKLRQEEERREAEERAKKEEEERIQKEEERRREEVRLREEERAKKEEEERIQKEEERRREEERLREERARKEREEERRRLEEQEKRKMEEIERIRKEEQEKIREEEKRKREEEEERTRKEKEEVDRMREQEKRKEEEERVRREEMERKEAEEKQKVGKKKLRIIPAENLSTNPFDEDFSPSEPSSSSAPEAPSRSVKTVQRCNSVTSSADEKDLINAQREKRPAPRPPGRSQPERRRPEEEEDLPAQPKTNGQSKEKEVRTVSVPPQRSVQVIAPLNRSSRDTKSETQTSNATKRPAPSRPLPVEEPKSSGRASLRGASEAKPVKTVQSLNPFDDDDDELTAQHDVTKSAGADKDDASLAKVKSSKMAHAPAPPAPSGSDSSSPSIRQDDGGPLTGGPGLNAPNQAGDPEPEAKRHEQVQESPNKNTPPAKVQKVMVAGVKEEGPTVNSRRLQTVKPLNPLEQQPAFVQEENDKPTALDCSKVQHNTKVDAVITGPYSQLTRDELISLVLKQEKQLADKDKKISELELYIDDLLVRVIEVQPSILMSMSSLK